MTTIEHKACYCEKPGLPEHFNNFVGRKGKVAYVQYCSEEHKKKFNELGDMVELFGSNNFMLKQLQKRMTEPSAGISVPFFY